METDRNGTEYVAIFTTRGETQFSIILMPASNVKLWTLFMMHPRKIAYITGTAVKEGKSETGVRNVEDGEKMYAIASMYTLSSRRLLEHSYSGAKSKCLNYTTQC